MDSDIKINTYSNPVAPAYREDRKNMSKVERIKKRRQERQQKEVEIEKRKITASVSERQPKPYKEDGLDRDNKHFDTSKSKFSSLFRNNPDIPSVDSCEVEVVNEKVFSADKFGDLGIHTHLVSCLEQRLGITQMTAVQKAAIPHILQKKDVLIKSQTGSGKTLCYAIPIVEQLQSREPRVQRSDGPFAIIISPTRELTLQSYETFQQLVRSFVWVVPGCIMGGEKKSKEKARIRKGINIVFGTPGRLLDHLHNTSSLCVENIRYLVIDEADRLLDMGFEKEISQIVTILSERCTAARQNILLSATLSSGVERLAGISLTDPMKIDIAEGGGSAGSASTSEQKEDIFTTPENLKHHYVIVPSKLRLVTLAAFILWKAKYSSKNKKLVVFLSTQISVEFYHKVLIHMLNNSLDEDDNEDSLQLLKLHGDMAQEERTSVFHRFIKTESGVLLCTDVAARGLNLQNVRWIVQYNTPGSATDYIHRVGRTARIGSQGHALIFLAPSEVDYLKVLQQYHINLSELQVDAILKTLLIDASKWKGDQRSFTPNTPQECATAFQMTVETYIQGNKDMRTLARKAYQSFIRSYATYPKSLKHIFHVKLLHLGHVAKSFGLQDAPTHIATVVSKNVKQPLKRPIHDRHQATNRPYKKPRLDLISEFSSGLDNIVQTNRKPKHNTNRKQFIPQKKNMKGFRK